MMGNGGAAPLVYQFLDEFLTAHAAPLDTPHTSEPGPGTLTRVQDTNNSISVQSNGAYAINPATSASGDGSKTTATWPWAPGLGCCVRFLSYTNTLWSGFRNSVTPTDIGLCFATPAQATTPPVVMLESPTGNIIYVPANAPGNGTNMLTNKGDYWVIRGADGGALYTYNNELLWVDREVNKATVTAAMHINGANRGGSVDRFLVRQLGAPFTTDFALATTHLAGARAQGDTFAHASGNTLIYFTLTTLPSDSMEIRFRIQDASNYWNVIIASTGAITLNEVVAAASTQRGSATGVSNGNRISIILCQSEIMVKAVRATKIDYNSAATFLAATSGIIQSLGTGGAVSEVETYAKNLSAAAIAQLANPAWPVYVGLGDSVTAGYGLAGPPMFVDLVGSWLKATTINSGVGGVVVENTAQNTASTIGGAVDGNMQDNVATRVTAYHPKYVTVMGVNDVRFSDAAFTAAAFQAHLGQIIDTLVAAGISASNICIGSPTYVDASTYGLSAPFNGATDQRFTDFTAACSAVAAVKGTKYVDIYAAMVAGGGTALLQADKIHPNNAGQTVIANAFIGAFGAIA